MRTSRTLIALLLGFLALAPFASAASLLTAQSGPWSDVNTWSGGAVPLPTDDATIAAGHSVTYDGEVLVGSVTVYGDLMAAGTLQSTMTTHIGGIVIRPGGRYWLGTQAVPSASSNAIQLATGSGATQYGLVVEAGGEFLAFGGTSHYVKITSTGTASDRPYVENLTPSPTSFVLDGVELENLGAGRAAVTFEGGAGTISSSTVRNSGAGIALHNAFQVQLESSVVRDNVGAGISLDNSSTSFIVANVVQQNGGEGIHLFNACVNNTIQSNQVFQNAGNGIQLQNVGFGNIVAGNDISGNSLRGLLLTGGQNIDVIGNVIHENVYEGLKAVGAQNVRVADGLLGYRPDKSSGPNGLAEVAVATGTLSTLELKNARINTAGGGVNTSGLTAAGASIISYLQNGSSGTVRIWGNHLLSNTLTLDWGTPLYGATPSAARLMRGNGHSINNPSVANASAVSQVISAVNVGGSSWEIRGSSSGFIGSLTCTPANTNCPFNHSLATFILRTGSQINTGDLVQYVTYASSFDSGYQKKLYVGPTGTAYNGGRSKVEVTPTGVFTALGGPTTPSLIDWLPGSAQEFTFVSSGAFNLTMSSVAHVDSDGLQLSGAGPVMLSSASFDLAGANPGPARSYLTLRSLTSNATFYGLRFLNSVPAGGTNYNISTQGTNASLSWVIVNATGPLAGVAYENDPQNRIQWSTGTVVSTATATIGSAGVGTASVVPSSVPAGSQMTSTVTYTVAAGGMSQGGQIQVELPGGWYVYLQRNDPNNPGYVSATTNGTATLAVTTLSTAPIAVVSLQSGSLSAGETISVAFSKIYVGCPVVGQTKALWKVRSATGPGTFPADIATQPTQSMAASAPARINFVPGTPLNLVLDQPSVPIVVQAQDYCGNGVNVATTTVVSLAGQTYNFSTYNYSADAGASFSNSSSFVTAITTVTIPVGTSSATFYYKTTTNSQSLNLRIDYFNYLNGYNDSNTRGVQIFTSLPTFSGISIDNGTQGTQTSATLTPDNDGDRDIVFIRFSPSNATNGWHVAISSDGFNTVVYDRWGVGEPSPSVTWDGRMTSFVGIAPNGTYQVKIEYPGLTQDTSLQLTVNSVQISGRVTLAGSAVSNAYINAQPTSGGGSSFGQTDSNGYYTLNGLRSGGIYNLYVNFASTVTASNFNDQLQLVTAPASNKDFAFAAPAVIRVAATLTSSSPVTNFGNVSARTTNYSKFYGAGVRLLAGATTSDNGDSFLPSTWSVLNVIPGTYVVELRMPNFDVSSQTVTAVAGSVTDVTIPLTTKAAVYGWVVLPSTVTSNTWVPVEGVLSGKSYPTVWGGTNIDVGRSSAVFTLVGVAPGTYTLRARPYGFIPAARSNVVVGATSVGDPLNGGADISGFTTGGQLTGTVTVLGDSTGIMYPSVNLNANSQALGLSFYGQAPFTPNASAATASYVISGMANGTYQVFPYLDGFEADPPNGQTVTVSGGSGSLNIVLRRLSGQINGTVSLPSGASDFNQVHLSLQGSDMREVDLSAASFSISNLRSGYYTLVATYRTSGAQTRQYFSVTNGQTRTVALDLSATTYSLSGTVSIASAFSMRSSTGTLVTVDSVSSLLANATSQTLVVGGQRSYDGTCSGGVATVVSSVRVEATPRLFNGSDSTRDNFTHCFGVGELKYAVLDSSGGYSVSGLTPGVWEISVYPYFDGGTAPNVAVTKQVVTITGASQTMNFSLTGGYSVSGTISLPAGLTDTKTFDVQVVDSRGTVLQKGTFDIGTDGTPASSVDYLFTSLPSGDYSLVIQERRTFDAVLGSVAKYVAKPVAFSIAGANLTNNNVTMMRAARMVGKLAIDGKNTDGTNASTLITSNNITLLPSNFSVSAQAFPWVEGGYRSAEWGNNGRLGIDDNSQFRIEGLVPGKYDVHFQQSSWGFSVQAAGSINLANQVKAQVQVLEGQTLDLGTITLKPGLSVSGTVTDSAGTALPNITVRANASIKDDQDGTDTTTDAQGKYTLFGLNPDYKHYDIKAAPRPEGNDTTPPVPYGTVYKRAVDVTAIPAPTVDFTLAAANASITGKVQTVDGGALSYPEDNKAGFPVAALYMKRLNAVSNNDDPLGEVRDATGLDGQFTIANLVPGTYEVTVMSLGYRPYKKTISLETTLSLGTITLQKGPSLTVTLTKPDGTPVSSSDVRFAAAATADMSSIIFGQSKADASTKNINSVVFSGFELNKRYSVLLFDQLDNIVVPKEAKNVTFTDDSESRSLALTYQGGQPTVFTNVHKAGDGVQIDFFFTRPLRNTQTFDEAPENFLSVTAGAGVLSDISVSGDRRQLTAVYTPSAGETTATLRFSAFSADVDPATGSEYQMTKNAVLLFGQKAFAEKNINPALGGEVTLASNSDPSGVTIPSNCLLTSTGALASAESSYSLSFAATDDVSGNASSVGGAKSLSMALARGGSAYLSEAYAAMRAARVDASINPMSAFYSVLLPAGLSHTLNQTATLTLSYDTGADPDQINVYYFDGSKYLIERANRTVDRVNRTISVGVSHFSTFVVLENSASVVTVNGDTASGLTLNAFNFPNPFDLTTKTRDITHGGSSSSMQTEGTIIRYTVPSDLQGPASIKIYNVAGERVRTIDLGTPASGAYHYVAWDGRNDSGNKVASGVYIGQLKVGGQTKIWKMAVIK